MPDASGDGEGPSRAGESVPDGSVGGEDLLGLRIGAALIDLALLLVLFVVLAVLVGEASVGGGGFSFSLDGSGFGVVRRAGARSTTWCSRRPTGKTVGKALVGVAGCGPPTGAGRIARRVAAIGALLR